jgi:hypothetical protein
MTVVTRRGAFLAASARMLLLETVTRSGQFAIYRLDGQTC